MSKRSLKIGNVTILFPGTIDQVIEIDGLTIVKYDFSGLSEDLCERNVWAFDSSGNLKWKIQRGRKDPDYEYAHPYNSVFLGIDGRLMVSSTYDEEFFVRLDNGTLEYR